MYDLNIDGYMSELELQQIEKWASQVPSAGIIVEVGSYKGRSSIAWATSCDPSVTVYCMDLFDDFGTEFVEDFKTNTANIPNIKPMKCVVPFMMPDWKDIPIDVFFLDGLNENPHDLDGIKYFLSLIKKGGLLCGHNYFPDNEIFPDVVSNVAYLEERLEQKVINPEGTSLWAFRV